MVQKKLLILGNSAAAISAIRAIREKSSIHSITLISREDYRAYSPVLMTYYLSGRTQEKDLFIIDEGFYKNAGVKCVLSKEVVNVDPSKQVVILNDGGKVDYDYLLIACGASPKTLDETNTDIAKDLCYLRTIEDAKKIRELSKWAKEIVIVGAGLVGMQIGNALYRKGVHLTFIVASKQILSQNIDEDCSSIIREHIESSYDSSFLFERNISEIIRKNGKYKILLDTGEELIADMVIVGKGVKPNTRLITNSGIDINQGILVDERMRTNVEGIYAAGDVAEGKNRITGKVELVPNWINACEQGRIAGLNMAGVAATFPGSVAANVTNLFGLNVFAMGLTKIKGENRHMEELKYTDLDRKQYRKMVVSGNRLLGVILLGDIQDIGIIYNHIVNSVDISPFKSEMPRTPLKYRENVLISQHMG